MITFLYHTKKNTGKELIVSQFFIPTQKGYVNLCGNIS